MEEVINRRLAAAPKVYNTYHPKPYEIKKGDFYVAVDGSDANPGTFEQPFATIEAAKQAIRKLKETKGLPEGGITVCIKAGVYETEGVKLEACDSGEESKPIVYRAYGDGPVTLDGGLKIKAEDLVPVTGAARERIPQEARDHVLCVDLNAVYGLTKEDIGPLYAPSEFPQGQPEDLVAGKHCELYFNMERMAIARYPNGFGNYIEVAGIYDENDPNDVFYVEKQKRGKGHFIIDQQAIDRAKRWQQPEKAWVQGYFRLDYGDQCTPVEKIDLETGEVVVTYVNPQNYRVGAPFCFYNVLEELDAPGEWYLDRDTCVMYLYPLGDVKTADIRLAYKYVKFFDIQADYITLEGLTMKDTKDTAITVNANHFNMTRCNIYDTSRSGIIGDGFYASITECEIAHIGVDGINYHGGIKETLTYGHIVVDNNCVHDFGEVKRACQYGIAVSGQGNRISHNEIYNSSTYGMGYSGNDNIIEYNVIHDVVTEADDVSAIYFGSSWTSRGNVLRYNCIYNLGGDKHYPDGIYWDDGLSGQTGYGNILVNVPKHAFMCGGGNENRIFNNLIVNPCMGPFRYDQRARDGYLNDGWFRGGVANKQGFLWEILRSTPYQNELWTAKYPILSQFNEDADPDDPHFPCNPAYSQITGNVVAGEYYEKDDVLIDEAVYKYSNISRNVYTKTIDEACFVDAANGDYRFRKDSPVWEQLPLWTEIPFDKMGRY